MVVSILEMHQSITSKPPIAQVPGQLQSVQDCARVSFPATVTPAADPLGIVKGFYCQICIRCSFGVSALAVVRWVCNYQVLLTEACLSFAIFLHAAFYIHSINLLKHIVHYLH